MSARSSIRCAFLFFEVYVIILCLVDGVSLRRKTRKDGESISNSTVPEQDKNIVGNSSRNNVPQVDVLKFLSKNNSQKVIGDHQKGFRDSGRANELRNNGEESEHVWEPDDPVQKDVDDDHNMQRVMDDHIEKKSKDNHIQRISKDNDIEKKSKDDHIQRISKDDDTEKKSKDDHIQRISKDNDIEKKSKVDDIEKKADLINEIQIKMPEELNKKIHRKYSLFHTTPELSRQNMDRKQNESLKMLRERLRQSTILVPLKLDELQPPDHIDGVRMEHDGHLNRDYKKEILLGNHEEFEWGSESKLISRLKAIFYKADMNQDDNLDLDELQAWIVIKVQEHLNETVADNKRVYNHLDTNHDGYVTWKEFYVHFLMAKGRELEEAKKQSEDYDSIVLDPDEKEQLIRYKFRWAEADEEPQDDRLTFHELMNFRHPEQSKRMLVRMVRDLIENFDRNDDKLITEEEFVMLPPGELDDANTGSDQIWLTERRKEFKDVIDLNKDGLVDKEELKVYVDPHNSNHAKLEAENLIHLADQDSDGLLSLEEVLENAELFLGSKMVDTSRNFHDEF